MVLGGDLVWSKLGPFTATLFFIFLGDALLSFWIPNFLQESLGSPFLMGLVMSFSSMVGLLADILFPQILKSAGVKKLLLFSILMSFVFTASLFLGVAFPILVVFALIMAIWGIYYEFVHFSQSQFVADSVSRELKSFAWAILSIFRNLAYFLGLLLAGIILLSGELTLLFSVILLTSISFVVFFLNGKDGNVKVEAKLSKISILKELFYWKVLFKRVWPVVVLSLLVGFVDAAFWTTGAVWTESLSQVNPAGIFLLPAYQMPSLFMGFVLAKWKIFRGKKRLSEKLLLISGLFLMLLYFDFPPTIYILLVFLSGIYLASAIPLIEAVYSDITSRMGIERKHMMGLSASTISIAYIISPPFAGLAASYLGEKNTFVVLGLLVAMTSIILLFVTPKKLRLPEKEIKEWGI